MNYFLFLFLALVILILNILLIKKNYLPSLSGDDHQKLTFNNSIPLSGGVYLIIIFFVLFYSQIGLLFFSIFFMFLIGLLSDIKIINSAKLRIILQFIIIFSVIIFLDLKILSTRIDLFDGLLETNFINYLFVSFCILIIVNGSNFIDGLNGLSLGYYLIILFAILNCIEHQSNFNQIFYLLCLLLILIVFNFFNYLFIGDNGAYILGLIFSYLLIIIYQNDPSISPYYIILLLWYPCFELLFSIIRKFNLNYSPIKPDVSHLHQLIYFLIKKKFNLTSLKSNNISSFVILSYNTFVIFLGSQDIYNTQLQVILILLSVIFYTLSYNLTLKYKKQDK